MGMGNDMFVISSFISVFQIWYFKNKDLTKSSPPSSGEAVAFLLPCSIIFLAVKYLLRVKEKPSNKTVKFERHSQQCSTPELYKRCVISYSHSKQVNVTNVRLTGTDWHSLADSTPLIHFSTFHPSFPQFLGRAKPLPEHRAFAHAGGAVKPSSPHILFFYWDLKQATISVRKNPVTPPVSVQGLWSMSVHM